MSVRSFLPRAPRTLALTCALTCALLYPTGCLREGRDRALGDLEIGADEADSVAFTSRDGLAHIRDLTDGTLSMWASAPVVEITLTAEPDARLDWTIDIENCMPGAELISDRIDVLTRPLGGPRPTICQFSLTLPTITTGEPLTTTLLLAPPDAGLNAPFRFAAMSDVQNGIDEVDDVFATINADPSIRFVISTGDLTSNATPGQYNTWLDKLRTLDVPFFATIGNHELFGDLGLWRRYFGRVSVNFQFQGAHFSLVDSASASIDPMVYDWLDEWIVAAKDTVHVFATHYPPTDPVGIRNGSFRSRNEASKLIGKLAAGGVDLTIYGHIHTYYGYTNGDIPAHISGGGGAFQERWDGVGRHVLAVDVNPTGISQVTVVEVD